MAFLFVCVSVSPRAHRAAAQAVDVSESGICTVNTIASPYHVTIWRSWHITTVGNMHCCQSDKQIRPVVLLGSFRLGSYLIEQGGYQVKYSFADCSRFKSICSICASWYLPHAISNTTRTGCSQVPPQTRAATCQSHDLCHLPSSPARAGPRRPIWTCATMRSFVFYNWDMF